MVTITLPVPLGAGEGGYVSKFVGTRLGHTQARALKSLQVGARRANAELINGRPVCDGAGMVRYILEQVAAELAALDGES